jgi:hypothetical protein
MHASKPLMPSYCTPKQLQRQVKSLIYCEKLLDTLVKDSFLKLLVVTCMATAYLQLKEQGRCLRYLEFHGEFV